MINENKAGSALLKGVEKIYINNTNIYKTITNQLGFAYKTGTVRELFFITMLQNAGEKIYYSKIGDFVVKGYYFEIGGENKSRRQVKEHIQKAFIVKDNTLYPDRNTIPLYLFGFLY